eukprot:g1925.t1
MLRTLDEAVADLDSIPVEVSSWIEHLPTDVLCKIYACCDPESFRTLQSCSKTLHSVALESIPSIRTRLLEHQKKSLKWMAWREQEGRKIKHFCKQYTQTHWGPLEIDEIKPDVRFIDKEEEFDDCRGGILADEPGLGKTATILSLIMRTRGILPSAPEGTQTFVQKGPDGCPMGWYWYSNDLLLQSFSPENRIRRVRSSEYTPQTPFSTSGSLKSGDSVLMETADTPQVKRPRTLSSPVQLDDEMDLSWKTSDEEEEEEEERQTIIEQWVCCDFCNTWRIVPADYEVGCSKKWFCYMHPERNQMMCQPGGGSSSSDDDSEIPERIVQGQTGYISANDGIPEIENLMHFGNILDEYWYCFTQPMNAVSALLSFAAEDLHKGVFIPMEAQRPMQYDHIFTKLGLIRAENESLKRDRYELEGDCWKIPDSHQHLNLDTFILSAAVASYRGQADHRTYLSQATLIVVPFPLIDQWKEEIYKHFEGNHLRVHVLTKQAHYPMKIYQLAWKYDVVLTSFTHLSSPNSEKLLQIHWLRVVLDEGHLIGTGQSRTTRKNRIDALKAERRWIITGTPTPDVAHRSTVNHLYPLVKFLQIKPFSNCRQLWDAAIQKPFNAGLPEGKRRLQKLLDLLMIRSFKTKMNNLVKISKKIVKLDFEPNHAASYNELVEVVQRNLLLADFGEEGHVESLLNRSNTKWASEMVTNVNLSCCVAGNCNLDVNYHQLFDTLQKLARRNSYSTEFLDGIPWWTPSHHPLRQVEHSLRYGGICSLCSERVRLPLVTPCVHLLCESCVKIDRYFCPTCHVPYKMQSSEDPARLSHNINPKLPVPIELIEWQPSYAQAGAAGISGGCWQPNWEATKSTKCEQLVKRLKEIGVVALEDKQQPVKAIVFTRFWPHMRLIARSLDAGNIPHCTLRRGLSPSHKRSEIQAFKLCHYRNVLLMDMTGAVGLDLSMANWVFLMEPLLDRSVEDQVVSRAYRMGAKDHIHVEIMIMNQSIEELVLKTYLGSEAAASNDGQQDEEVMMVMDRTELKEDNIKIRNALISGLNRVTKSNKD